MKPTDLLAAFNLLDEAPVLADCARRLGSSFNIVGGVVRNLALRLASGQEFEGEPVSMFQMVDAVSDIDLVVDDPNTAPRLMDLIGSSLPMARFFRWEIRTRSMREQDSNHFEHFPIDRLEIQVTEDGAHLVQGLAMDVSEALKGLGKKTVEMPHFQNAKPTFTQFLHMYLKLARYSRQMTSLTFPDKDKYDEALESYRRRSVDTQMPSNASLFRVICEAIDLIVNSVSASDAIADVGKVLNALPEQYFHQGKFGRLLEKLKRISESVVPSRHDAYFWAAIVPSKDNDFPALTFGMDGGSRSGTPWVILRWNGSPDHYEDCCYEDFSQGAAVVVWSRINPPIPNVDRVPTILKARLINSAASISSPFATSSFVSLPSLVQNSLPLVVRLDHGYAYAIGNPGAQLECALLRVE